MPVVRRSPAGKRVLAVCTADLHFSHARPACVKDQATWYGMMERYLIQFRRVCNEYENVPLIVAGDFFDRWNEPAEVINFVMSKLPAKVYAVCGQHDMPYHAPDELHRSAYWTLVESRVIEDLTQSLTGKPVYFSEGALTLRGFPYGESLAPCENPHDLAIEVAVAHKYCWVKGKSFPGAPAESRARVLGRALRGYDVAVVGDNHQPFEVRLKSGCLIFNCGPVLRRRKDEMGIRPSVGLLHEDKTVTRHYLNTSGDEFVDSEEEQTSAVDVSAVVAELSAEDGPLDFADAVNRGLDKDKVTPGVRRAVLQCLPGTRR